MKNKYISIQIEENYEVTNTGGKVIIENEEQKEEITVFIETSTLYMIELSLSEARKLTDALTAAIRQYDDCLKERD